MPQLDQRYFYSQFTICIVILFITYIIVNNKYFKKYVVTLNNRNKFINFHTKKIIYISEKIKSESVKIISERIILFEKIKNEIEKFKKKKYTIEKNQLDIISQKIYNLESIHKESGDEIQNLLKKIYKKYYIRIKKYIVLFLIK